MIAIAASLLLAAHSWQPPATPGALATVRICSLQGVADQCTELSAARLDPTLGASSGDRGLVAFVDPQTGMPVEPTAEQLLDFASLHAYEKQRGAPWEVTVETLPDGTRRARLGSSFMVDLGVEIQAAPSSPAAEPPR